MGEGLSHWSNMVLRKSQTYFFDRHTHPNSMYSNFCHVLKLFAKLTVALINTAATNKPKRFIIKNLKIIKPKKQPKMKPKLILPTSSVDIIFFSTAKIYRCFIA